MANGKQDSAEAISRRAQKNAVKSFTAG